jgi:hypothetical protein
MNLVISEFYVVIPAKSGNPGPRPHRLPPGQARGGLWTPAFAGVTCNALILMCAISGRTLNHE